MTNVYKEALCNDWVNALHKWVFVYNHIVIKKSLNQKLHVRYLIIDMYRHKCQTVQVGYFIGKKRRWWQDDLDLFLQVTHHEEMDELDLFVQVT